MKPEEIIQIIPADGWYAKYQLDADEEGNEMTLFSPLICWALIKGSSGFVSVAGMDADESGCIDSAEGASNFIGFHHATHTRKTKKPEKANVP